jgi:FkbM family methyltransferase
VTKVRFDPAVSVYPVDYGDGVQVQMYCPTDGAFKRSHKVLYKEPETIAWLDRLPPGAVLWDIGANVGSYSLYAAVKKASRVIAFEPSAANYLVLNRNIEINGLQDTVTALCIAVAERSGLDVLYLPSTEFGAALCNYGSATDYQSKPFQPTFKQGAVGFSLGDLAAKLPFPTHAKIDVDGLEHDNIAGGAPLLSDARLRSVVIELDFARPHLVTDVVRMMRGHGFTYANEAKVAAKTGAANAVFDRAD